MNSRIEHWQRTYRVRAPAAQRRLDALAAGAVLEAYHAGLHRAFGDAPGVVLVRRVGLRFAANLTGAAEGEFARRWGEAMAVAVARTVADDPGNGNVVRYSDEAAHLAAFLAEVAAGRAADEWFFARFAEYRRHSARETIAEALLARPDRRAAVLRRLSEAGALRCVLGLLDDRTLSRLWSDGAAATDAERPLFAAALSLLAALGAAPVGAPQAETLFADFLTAAPPTDWRDRTQLARTVFAAARFLLARAPLRPPPTSAVVAAVAGLDWLDAEWLTENLLALLAARPTHTTRLSTQRAEPTPRQRQWLEAMRTALPGLAADLDPSDLSAPRNLLLAQAALARANPAWTDDPALAAFVQALLTAAQARPGRAGEARPDRLAEAGREPALAAVRLMGEPAAAIVRELAALAVPQKTRESWAPTSVAGAFLLLRAVNDLRLGRVARAGEFPVAGTSGVLWLTAALAARWAGLPSADAADAGLEALTAGADPSGFRDAWADATGTAGRFQQALAGALLGHRLLSDPARLNAALLARPGGVYLLLAGDEASQVWPFAALLASPEDADAALDQWREQMRTLTGSPVTASAPDRMCPAVAAWVESLDHATVGDADADITLLVAAQSLLRVWSRWLGRIGSSSTPYLLANFIRRPGRVALDAHVLHVEIEPRPLDIVLQRAGYLEPIELPHGWPFRAVRFQTHPGGAHAHESE